MAAGGVERWRRILPADPLEWLLESGEPSARWIALTRLSRREARDAEASEAKEALLADPGTRELIERLPDWEKGVTASGHNSPRYAPNLLHLLADLGLEAADHPRIEGFLDQLLAHQDGEGRFQAKSSGRWGVLLCDAHCINEALVRFGRAEDPRTLAALERMEADCADTAQGRAWPCRPDPVSGFRGPGRKADFCPMVSLEALRTFARLPAGRRPPWILQAARTALRAWRLRGEEKPYQFGHGRQFKTVKWPAFWYGAWWALDALSRYPELWRGRGVRAEDRRALAELAACLVAYNTGPDGRVLPRSCFQGFAAHSFGQKKTPSAFATARVCVILRRLEELAPDIAAVDVRTLGSSKGGKGIALPPP